MRFELTHQPIDIDPHRGQLRNLHAGGYCAFEGWVRELHLGKAVTSLEYEAYPALALKQGNGAMDDALNLFEILDARAVHRTGRLLPGDLAVWIGVTAAHRDAAFEACRHIIDAIKATVPIWKHEFYVDGTDVWVDPTDCHCAAKQETQES